MTDYRKISILAGTLYIIGFISGLLSIVPAIDASDYLIKASANENQVLIGALFQFIMTIAYLCFAITLYPILKKFNERLALGFLSFRIVAAILNILGIVSLLLLLSLSQGFVKAGTPDSSYFQSIGDLLQSGRDFVNHVAMILSLSIGGLMFYFLLYITKLIPRFISLWGLLGTVLTIFASFLIMFHIIDIITTIYIALNLPL
ncbi:DUF4386 domain-containing protein, partial [Bacteroidota bacterium]